MIGQRSLAVAASKRDAEDLSSYLRQNDVKASYIHCGKSTQERADALKSLQTGKIDCLVGVNLLREGLDLPEVSLVAILNADFEGFLRSETSLLQSVGRCARHVEGTAIFYAKRTTESMQRCIDATKHRREKQLAYNEKHGCEMRSTKGSSTMSIFDLSKKQIEDEQLKFASHKSEKQCLNSLSTTVSYPNFRTGSPDSIELDHVPTLPGCYFWRDQADSILYIGKAASLRTRVKSYLAQSTKHSPAIKIMLGKARSVEFIVTPSERDALVLESNLIKLHQPPYNVLLTGMFCSLSN